MGEHVFVTGGAGYVGTILCEHLLQAGHRVMAVDNLRYGGRGLFDFLMLAMNQIVNHAAKARYMYGGAVSVPIVVRAIIGKSWGQGAQHSQGWHSFFMHVPGLRVAAPATAFDATLLADDGLDVEVIDPVWLCPLDNDTIVDSARRTGILLVVDTGWTNCGASAEILARIAERAHGHQIRMARLGFAPVTCPTTKNLEELYYPNPRSIAERLHVLVRGAPVSWGAPAAGEASSFRGPF